MADKIVRTKTIQCSVSEEEYNKIEKETDKIGLSVGSYLRMVCLFSKLDTATNTTEFINLLKISEGYTDKKVDRKKVVQSKVSEEEYEKIEKKANNIGLSIVSYLRMVCLFSKLDISIDAQNI